MVESKILLIEDDQAIVENLSAFLKEEGFEVTAADGQTKAMEILESGRPDLILLDYDMQKSADVPDDIS